MKSLIKYLNKKKFFTVKEKHENQRLLTYDILKKRLYDKDCSQEEKELIKKQLEYHQIL